MFKKWLKLERGFPTWPCPLLFSLLWEKLEAMQCEGFNLDELQSSVLISDLNNVY